MQLPNLHYNTCWLQLTPLRLQLFLTKTHYSLLQHLPVSTPPPQLPGVSPLSSSCWKETSLSLLELHHPLENQVTTMVVAWSFMLIYRLLFLLGSPLATRTQPSHPHEPPHSFAKLSFLFLKISSLFFFSQLNVVFVLLNACSFHDWLLPLLARFHSSSQCSTFNTNFSLNTFSNNYFLPTLHIHVYHSWEV